MGLIEVDLSEVEGKGWNNEVHCSYCTGGYVDGAG
jgi:hypothetical protein